MTRNRVILSIAVLLFAAGGLWLACSETGVTPPAAPAAPPDKGWTATGAETSNTEVTLDPALVASQRPSRATGHAAVVTQLRLENKYGERWDEVASLIRAIAVLRGSTGRVGVFDEMLDPLKLARWKSAFPTRTPAEQLGPPEDEAARWGVFRQRVLDDGNAPVPPTYAEMQKWYRNMNKEEQTDYSISVLTQYVEYLKSGTQPAGPGRGSSGGGAMLSFSVSTAYAAQSSCRTRCYRRAVEVFRVLDGICIDGYHGCCAAEGPCYAGSDAREYCVDELDDCQSDALDVYHDWYNRCRRYC